MLPIVLALLCELAPPVGPPPDTYRPACRCQSCECEVCECEERSTMPQVRPAPVAGTRPAAGAWQLRTVCQGGSCRQVRVWVPAVCVAVGPVIIAGRKPSGPKWDVHERIHAHAAWFMGVVEAQTQQEALALARKQYGPKAYVVPYYREGIVQAPLDWHDLGCYQQQRKAAKDAAREWFWSGKDDYNPSDLKTYPIERNP